jgi:hypothetical protein
LPLSSLKGDAKTAWKERCKSGKYTT